MKKIVFTLLFILSAISGFSQVDEPTITFGINTGLDHNINAYRFQPYSLGQNDFYYTYSPINPQFNVGIDFGVILNKKMRARVELRYVNTQYNLIFDHSHDATPVPAHDYFVKSRWTMYNLDFNMHFDYLLYTLKDFEVFASPGLKFEFNEGQFIRTVMGDGSLHNEHFQGMEIGYPTVIAGGALSMILKYNITKHIGFTLTPNRSCLLVPKALF